MPQVKVIQPLSEQSKKLRVAAYARVSSDSADQLNSFATQVDYYTGYIQSKEEWEFAGLYADEAISGITADKRSDFQRLLADCHAGKIDRILVKSISRFARNTLDCIQTVRELKQLNIPVEFEKENIDTGSLGSEMLLSVLGAAAQEESLSISKNLKWNYRHRMKNGDFTTHIAPFGYSYKSKTLVPNPNEVPTIEYIFNSYLSGKSLSEIAKELNQNEKLITSEKHPEWNRTSIQYILTNEKYVGDSLVQKRFTPDELPLKKIRNVGQLPRYAHTGTGSDGDIVDYQIISTLPTITSNATALTTYTFVDTLSKGIEYNKKDVQIEWFTDKACTDKIATWTEADNKFTVTYGTAANNATTMKIEMTDTGLSEINNSDAVYDLATSLYRGYSDCTMRITYKATVNSSADTVYGDNGNPNDVVLTWKRTNTTYYDTLEDDCHFYVYGLDLLKQFSDGKGDFKNVQFKLYNNTDKYWVTAELNETEGIYYVKDQADKEADATTFIPVSTGALTVKGLEDDEYIITEIATDDGYTLLKDSITVVITSAESGVICDVCGKSGITATATVNGDAVGMIEDNGSVSAIVPMSVINTLGFDLPQTGENGTWLFAVGGVLIVSLSAAFIFFILAKKRKTDEQ